MQIPLSLTSLAAGQSDLVDLGAMQDAGLNPSSVSMGSITISYDGPQGALMGRVFGIANDPTYGFYSALETETPARLNEVYWTTAGDANSFLTVTNFGAQPDQISIVFTFAGGTWAMPNVTLAPFESTTVNVRDWKGRGLPANVDYGGFRVLGSSAVQSKLVAKEEVISESLRGVCALLQHTSSLCNWIRRRRPVRVRGLVANDVARGLQVGGRVFSLFGRF